MNYKIIFSLIFLFAGIFYSCTEDENASKSSASITGPDLRQCICCGGYLIEIGDSIYNFESLPAAANIDLTTATFPIAAELDWTRDRKCGDIRYINITRIERK